MTRVALVQAPVFLASSPPNALALLNAELRAAGMTPTLHDISAAVQSGASEALGLSSRGRWEAFDNIYAFDELRRREPALIERLMDESVRRLADARPDIAGFAVLAGTENASRELARRLKALRPATTVVFGGPQCLREAHAPEFAALAEVDAVAMGEADVSFPAFCAAWRRGAPLPRVPGFLLREGSRVVDCGDAAPVEDLDALPFMDFTGFDMSLYGSKILHLSTSRGCVRKCAFCTHIVQHKTFRVQDPARVIAEIGHHLAERPERSFVEFGDSLVNGDVRRLERLAERFIGLRLERAIAGRVNDFGWGGMAILHPTMTPRLLRKLRHGGCKLLLYGLESGSQKVVDLMGKNFRVSDAEANIRDTADAGIQAGVFVLVGFPGEDEEDFEKTLELLRRNARWISRVSTSVCEVQKGSRLERDAASFGMTAPVSDGRRWTAADGSSDAATRRARHDRLLAELARLGIETNSGVKTRLPI